MKNAQSPIAKKISGMLRKGKFRAQFLRQRKRLRNSGIKTYLKKRELTDHEEQLVRILNDHADGIYTHEFINAFIKTDGTTTYLDFAGAKLPDPVAYPEIMYGLIYGIFEDTFLIPVLCNDNYDKSIVKHFYRFLGEGPYGYKDSKYDITVKKGDIVIDAGAWAGDFSAYAASRGGCTYAFEPVSELHALLQKTAELNPGIIPVQCALGETASIGKISTAGVSSSITAADEQTAASVPIVSLDQFVQDHGITRVDFIKADIEGAERDMLNGATEVLRKFAPKLAICTYHLKDDPEILSSIILKANPKYKIIFLRKKLFACVIN